MGLRDITRAAVLAAIEEYDQLGQDEFLAMHGFDRARSYLLVYDGKAYDSKAIVGVAHGFLPGERSLAARDFSGGDATVGRLLRGLGFTVRAQRPTQPASEEKLAGHAFLSYVREDSGEVAELQRALEAAGVRVWRDTANLWPGEDWRAKIRDAITRDALVFIACFSSRSAARQKSYQNEELLLAVEQLRLRRPGDPWLIPVRFDECEVPDIELGFGRTLSSIQRADLFGEGRELALERLMTAITRILGQNNSTVRSV
jgi:TIR domain